MYNQETCWCNAYPFPHRASGGKCRLTDRKMAKSDKCGHEYTYDGWPQDELCPGCFFAIYDSKLDEIEGMGEEELHLREARQQQNQNSIIAALLRELERVEWIDDGDEVGKFCPWCGNYEHTGHYSGCTRQDAIAQARELK